LNEMYMNSRFATGSGVGRVTLVTVRGKSGDA